MNSDTDASRRPWIIRNRMGVMTVAVVIAYGGFLQWAFGWPVLVAQFGEIGAGPLSLALVLLVATYVVRGWRIHDYFPRETKGAFRRLLRLTLVHNLLNIMLPMRAGETSFPLLMRAEFGMPLARATAALLVMRLFDLHALLAAGGLGLVLGADRPVWGWALWLFFFVAPLPAFALKRPLFDLAGRLPTRLQALVAELERGMPVDRAAFLRAWAATALNWGVKVLVLAWVLTLMGVHPLSASFGGALGGELSSVLPVHAPGGVGTYPAGIVAGGLSFGAEPSGAFLAVLGKAAVNAHLLILLSAIVGTGLAVLMAPGSRKD
ncbi:MAG: lysylphosphatidylglycerol synthase domain-containing protein [Rhizobium sp.]|nr:lysylphosphatidylglycerol synthase domain-containing protein [Rhizobium sp.]